MKRIIQLILAGILIFSHASVLNQGEKPPVPVRKPAEKPAVVLKNEPQKPRKVASRGTTVKRWVYVEATAYTHTGNRTATGKWPARGMVAVDPDIIPLGSHVYVPGYGHAIAADTGGAIKGYRMDLFMDTERQAVRWGRKKVKVEIFSSKVAKTSRNMKR